MHGYNPSAFNGLRVKLAVLDFIGVAEYQEGEKNLSVFRYIANWMNKRFFFENLSN